MHRGALGIPDRRQLIGAIAVSGGTLAVGALLPARLGIVGVLPPLVFALLVIAMLRPLATVTVVVGLGVLCEGTTFGVLHFLSMLYEPVYKGITRFDVLIVFALFTVCVDAVRHDRKVRVPRPLVFGLTMLALGMLAGAATGHGAGGPLRSVIVSQNVLAYLLLLPVAVANLEIDRHRIRQLLLGGVALAIFKALIGLVEIAGGYGSVVLEGESKLTYYEPTANWIIMMSILGLLAAALMRVRPRWWMVLGSPLLIACLLLSYRRSFWIATVLGLLLVYLLGSSPTGRRMLVPISMLIVGAIWLASSVGFQAQGTVIERATSLSPSTLENNAEDRYRLDERANVLAQLRRHPFTGLGITVPWPATTRPLPSEHENGRQYVHFAALWFWLKLGLLGLIAYISIMLGSMVLAFQAWRLSSEPLLRAFGLASLCGFIGLAVMDTTASFTGVELRLTVLLAAQIGLLARTVATARSERTRVESANVDFEPPRKGGTTSRLGRAPA